MSYSHASELQRTRPPLSRLDYLNRQLGEWAKLNPSLRSLHSEFETIARELREAGAGDLPPEILPEGPDAFRRACPRCAAAAGHPCVSASGKTLWNYTHLARQT
jgi:hypothetical protein